MKGSEKNKLEAKAREKYGDIYPVGTSTELSAGFVVEGDRKMFWFNTIDGSTRLELL